MNYHITSCETEAQANRWAEYFSKHNIPCKTTTVDAFPHPFDVVTNNAKNLIAACKLKDRH